MILRPFKLAYVHLESKELDVMEDYYTNVIGLVQTKKAGNESSYFSVGYDHHNIVLTQGKEENLLAVGWQIDDGYDLKDVKRNLNEKGIQAEIQTDALAGIPSLVEVKGSEGHIIHLFNEMTGTSLFPREGIQPLRLGHIAICAKDKDKMTEFYKETLNFWETDRIEPYSNFLTCNELHHTLNVSKGEKYLIHHIAFELNNFSEHKNSGDLLSENGYQIGWGPSRHTTASNIATYHEDPEGRITELYTDMDRFIPELNQMEARSFHVDKPQKPKDWGSDKNNSIWGTEFNTDLIFNRLIKK